MLAPTHLIAGQTAYLGTCLASGHAPNPAEGLGAAAAGLAPDLDKRSGIVGRLFPFISEPLDFYFGHRTLTTPCCSWWRWGLTVASGAGGLVVAGVASHQVADWATPGVVAWFRPSMARAVISGNADFRGGFDGMGRAWGHRSRDHCVSSSDPGGGPKYPF